MLNGQPQQRTGGPEIPLASRPMSLDSAQTDAKLNQMGAQVDQRLQGLSIGQGPMSGPDVTPYKSELDQMSDEQRQMRLLRLKQEHAKLAMDLWSITFDPRREDAAARAAADKNGTAPAASGSTAAGAPVPGSPAAVAADKAAADKAAADKAATTATTAAASASASAAAAQAAAGPSAPEPFPKVLSITGQLPTPGHRDGMLKATLLVPYVGEVNAVVGTQLPGKRRVSSISAEGVSVSDPRLGTVPLGYGDSVPLTPPVVNLPTAPTAVSSPFPRPAAR